MSRVEWRIYYDDFTTYDNLTGPPEAAPGLGVQAIVQRDNDVGRVILTMFDWYYWRHDIQEWWASDYFGLLDQLTSDKANHVRAVRAGRNASAYKDIMQLVYADTDFPVKSARIVGERG